MGDNKGQTIFLSVIGIATLLVAIIGATFAYFTTTMGGAPATVQAGTATLGNIAFTAQSVEADNILPGWTSNAKTVTITRTGDSDVDFAYTCTLKATSTIADLYVQTADTAGKELGSQVTAERQVTTEDIDLFKGTIEKGTGNVEKSGTYTLTFKETGTNQNTQAGQTIAATVSCALDESEFKVGE